VEEEVERYLHLYMMLIFTTYLVVGTHLTTTQKTNASFNSAAMTPACEGNIGSY